ncbi:GntR family transcriptional regulator [Streptomyces sp. NPDC088915]|uniref:GntR family transcriptional regulator n=1 Tax=Streptomyces sp. NPDC088915 TaxID=3365912 RepID=UPI003828EB34
MTPQIDRTPPYLQVVQSLRRRITNGELADGERIPSVRDIAHQWKISQATAMKAVSALRAEGLVESITGVGTVVRTRANLHRGAHDRFARMVTTGKIYGPGEFAVIHAAELAPAPAHVAEVLGIDEGAEAIRRHRVTHNEDGPVSASTSWFTADLAEIVPELLVKERIVGGTGNAIANATGRKPKVSEDRSTVDYATAEQAAELGIEEGSPVLMGRNVLRDSEGDPMEVGEHISGPGRWLSSVVELPDRS